MDSSVNFGTNMPSHVVTLAPPREYGWTCAFFSPPESTNQMTNRSVQPFLNSSWQKVPILYNGHPFPPKLLLPMEGPGPPSKLWFLGPVWADNPNDITIGSSVLAQMSAECPYTLQWAIPPLPPQNCPFPWGNLDPHLIHGFLGLPESSTQTASWSVHPFLQGSLVWQTDRQTMLLCQ